MVLIDAATHFGHDKMAFEDRIQWTQHHFHELEMPHLVEQAEALPLPKPCSSRDTVGRFTAWPAAVSSALKCAIELRLARARCPIGSPAVSA